MDEATPPEEPRDEAFTLIELVVVVLILGILAAIAIPVFLSQRDRAWDSVTQSQLRNAAVSMASYYTDTGSYASDGLAPGYGYVASPEVALSVVSVEDHSFCIEAHHVSRPSSVLSVSSGATVQPDACS